VKRASSIRSERIPRGGALARIPFKVTSLEQTGTVESQPIQSSTARGCPRPLLGSGVSHHPRTRTPPHQSSAYPGRPAAPAGLPNATGYISQPAE